MITQEPETARRGLECLIEPVRAETQRPIDPENQRTREPENTQGTSREGLKQRKAEVHPH